MKTCPKCGAVNEDDYKFCESCAHEFSTRETAEVPSRLKGRVGGTQYRADSRRTHTTAHSSSTTTNISSNLKGRVGETKYVPTDNGVHKNRFSTANGDEVSSSFKGRMGETRYVKSHTSTNNATKQTPVWSKYWRAVAAVAFVLVIAATTLIMMPKKHTTTSTEAATEIVETGIHDLFSTASFTNASEQDQRKQISNMLDEFYRDGLIPSQAEYYTSSKLYTFDYADGTMGGICLQEFNDQINSGVTTYSPPGEEIISKYTGNGIDVLVLNGFENTEFRRSFYYQLGQEWSHLGIGSTVDTDVTVADLVQLDDYDVIIFSMHGNFYENKPVLCLKEEVTSSKNRTYNQYIKSKTVSKVYCTDSKYYYWVHPEFFEQNYSSNALDGTIFFSESCKFYGTDDESSKNNGLLSNALIGRGAEAVWGYHNSVMAVYSRDVMKYTLEAMFNGMTAPSALDAATAVYGENDGVSNPAEGKFLAYPLLYMSDEFERQGMTLLGEYIQPVVTTPPTPTEAPDTDLFDETYWHWNCGPTLGMNYMARFHSDGTYEYYRLGSGYDMESGEYSYSNGVLVIDNSAKYDLQADGSFKSREQYESAMMGEGIHYILAPSDRSTWELRFGPTPAPTPAPTEAPVNAFVGNWRCLTDRNGFTLQFVVEIYNDGTTTVFIGEPNSEMAWYCSGTWSVDAQHGNTYSIYFDIQGGDPWTGENNNYSAYLDATVTNGEMILQYISGDDISFAINTPYTRE